MIGHTNTPIVRVRLQKGLSLTRLKLSNKFIVHSTLIVLRREEHATTHLVWLVWSIVHQSLTYPLSASCLRLIQLQPARNVLRPRVSSPRIPPWAAPLARPILQRLRIRMRYCLLLVLGELVRVQRGEEGRLVIPVRSLSPVGGPQPLRRRVPRLATVVLLLLLLLRRPLLPPLPRQVLLAVLLQLMLLLTPLCRRLHRKQGRLGRPLGTSKVQ